MSRRWPCVGCNMPITFAEEKKHDCPVGFYYSRAGNMHAQCKECRNWPMTDFEHWCSKYKKGQMDISKKRWDHTIQAWVLDLPAGPTSKFYDAETKSWVAEKDFYASSCEIPPEDFKKDKKDKETYNTYGTYQPCYPWEGVDRKKWPKTWWQLILLYYQDDWNRGHYISVDDWKARLKGEYRPLPAWGRSNYTPHSSYGPYHDMSDYGEC